MNNNNVDKDNRIVEALEKAGRDGDYEKHEELCRELHEYDHPGDRWQREFEEHLEDIVDDSAPMYEPEETDCYIIVRVWDTIDKEHASFYFDQESDIDEFFEKYPKYILQGVAYESKEVVDALKDK